MLAVVQLKLGGPTNNLIQTVRKHVATSLEVVADHLIVNKAVATIVKSEVWGGGGEDCNLHNQPHDNDHPCAVQFWQLCVHD